MSNPPPPQPSSGTLSPGKPPWWRRGTTWTAVFGVAGIIGVVVAVLSLGRDLTDYTIGKPVAASPSATSSSSSASAPLPVVQAGSEPPVYSSGPTSAYAPNWGVSLDKPWHGVHVNQSDFAVEEASGVSTQPNVFFAKVVTDPGYATCRAANYTINFVPMEELLSPTTLCVRRADGRVGKVQLLWNGQKGTAFVVKIDGVVWEPAR